MVTSKAPSLALATDRLIASTSISSSESGCHSPTGD
ncbi:hypothetical protein Q427_30505 [Halomonas sp. BC04]|nr:hypothetical protein Q427_30505 [Halomonas sp. BC04]